MLKNVTANWQTSTSGAILIAIGVLGAAFGVVIPGFTMDAGPAIAAGIGLLLAKDGGK
jgi:hypothetical protein